MNQEDIIDSDLQRSLEQLDEEFNQQNSDDQNSQAGDNFNSEHNDSDQQGNDNKKGKKIKQKQQVKNHLREKKSALDQLLPPDEDVDSIPPFVVVVQGSKSSGKSTIIRSLVKNFTKHKIDQINGTITLRSTKKQRITIIQCPNDLRAMIDLSKIADIVLLLIDASLGFEMETFQFLSLLKCHGFPHIMGALTHLDFYKQNKQLRKAKKKFKKRFQYQVGGNNKLFNLSKWDNGLYPKIETSKIARYIGTSNPPRIMWRLNHPFVLADRWQVSQDRNYQPDDLVDVDFYGYIRGASYRMNGKMHFVGLGDYLIKKVQVISDPCPEYKKQEQQQNKQEKNEEEVQENQEQQDESSNQQVEAKKQNLIIQPTKKKRKRRTLAQNQRIIYAPSCNLGTLSFEHTSGYVTIPHEYVKFTRRQNPDEEQYQIEEGVQMVRNLQDIKQTINQKLKKRQRDFQLFEGVKLDDEQDQQQNDISHLKRKKKQLKEMKQKTQNLLIPNDQADRVNRQQNLSYLIYQSKQTMTTYDCSKFHPQPTQIDQDSFKSLFVTGMEGDALNQMSDQNQQDDDQAQKKKKIDKILKKNVKKVKINENSNFFQKGFYVKIVLQKIKYSDYKQISTKMPIILSRINLGQDNLGFIKVNFKRHRWYSNLLKSNDPIIVSSGWRRYQTLITFAKTDPNERIRFLKYTPHYDFCVGVFYGNFNQQNSGCVFTQTIKNDLKKFRIAGSGLITQINKSFEIMKKIKLIGQPFRIMKNTAFIRGMFNSNLEVANYIGAQIRTVSGIRGQIKKGTKEGGEGTFRATFQDKILMSDIVFCRAWYRVILDRFYNPIINFGKNRLMKTKYELRIQKGQQIQLNPDSEYKNVDRAPQTFKPLMVPKKLQGKLPFKTLQKVKSSKKQQIKRKQNQGIPKVLMSDKQREVTSLIQRLNTIRNQKQAVKQQKFKQKQRIRSAMQRPKQEYYQKLKKEQKSNKMATLMRAKNKQLGQQSRGKASRQRGGGRSKGKNEKGQK